MNTFLFSYDFLSEKITSAQLHQFIANNNNIERWILAYPGLYILKTSKSGKAMTDMFTPFMNGGRYVVSKVERTEATGGHLSREIWDWFNDTSPTALPSE